MFLSVIFSNRSYVLLTDCLNNDLIFIVEVMATDDSWKLIFFNVFITQYLKPFESSNYMENFPEMFPFLSGMYLVQMQRRELWRF